MQLWTPTDEFIENSRMEAFKNFLENKYPLKFSSYEEMHQWSLDELGEFWESIVHFFNIDLGTYSSPLQQRVPFYQSTWFDGAHLSYAALVFKKKTADDPAMMFQSEKGPLKELSWEQLELAVASLQSTLRAKGVSKGDRVVAYALNTPETAIAFLAANSLGAIWSSCSPDFGVQSVVDRFKQVAPKVFFAHHQYEHQGRFYDISEKVRSIQTALPTLEASIELTEALCYKTSAEEIQFEKVSFNHPIWILYSSGTTGKPKAITHSTGGIVLEHLKALGLHQNVREGERYFWYSTTGWMMWNYALSSLLCGATLCFYNGSPTYPTREALWRFAQKATIHHFGGGAAYYTYVMQNDLLAELKGELSIKTIGSTGSPLSGEAFDWFYKVLPQAQLVSISGGTDVCTAFVGGNPWLPVHSGEIQCALLGVDVQAWNDRGENVQEELGELIIANPMPSMPIYFWKDEDNTQYHSSYFEKYNGVWCHGDWIKITRNRGIVIFGRSDATLNKNGVRIGTAEIYNALDSLMEINDSLIVNIEKPDGSSVMPLFVVTEAPLDKALIHAIKSKLKSACSPRHIPDKIFKVPEIPYTISGKKMEVPVKKILMGVPLEKAATLDAMRNPKSLAPFVTMVAHL